MLFATQKFQPVCNMVVKYLPHLSALLCKVSIAGRGDGIDSVTLK